MRNGDIAMGNAWLFMKSRTSFEDKISLRLSGFRTMLNIESRWATEVRKAVGKRACKAKDGTELETTVKYVAVDGHRTAYFSIQCNRFSSIDAIILLAW